jgi:hypothetical protein
MLKKSLVIAFMVLATQVVTIAQDSENNNKIIRTTVPFLTISPDSRSSAMGDAGVATSPDINSQHWNASKYIFAKDQAGVALSYTPWLRNLGVNDLNLLYLTGYYKFGERQAVSSSIRYFNLGEIQEVIDGGNGAIPTGNTIRPHEYAIDIGYSRMFSEYFSAGLVFRYIHSDIASGSSNFATAGAAYEPANSFAADISTYFHKPVRVSGYDAKYALGLNISNVGTKMTYSDDGKSQPIPTNMRLGGSFELDIDEYNSFGVHLDLNKLLVPINDSSIGVIEGIFKSFYDAPGGFQEELQEIMWSVGLEYWYLKQFAIRGGYFHEHQDKGNRKYFTVGVGLNYNVFSLDFSYLFPAVDGRNNPLANTIRFTLGFRFE